MTGFERLREYAREMDEDLYGDCEEGQKLHNGHCPTEGCRICHARVINDIADQIEREHSDDHEITEWVRDNGGIENIKDELANDRELVMVVCDALWPDGKVPCCENGNEQIADELDKRLMPPGMEWPKVDGKKVDFTTGYEPSLGVLEAVEIYNNGACNVMSHDGIVKSVSDIHIAKQDPIGADGLPIKIGETVWHKDGRGPWTVEVVHVDTDQVTCLEKINVSGTYPPLMLTHTKPVIGADHLPIKKGDTVYLLHGVWCDEYPCLGYHGGEELEVFEDGEPKHVKGAVKCRDKKKGALARGVCYPQPHQLTHTKPDIMGADGKPLKVGDTVWDINGGEHGLVITSVELDELEHVKATQEKPFPANVSIHPSRLTHTKPEPPDSWEQLEKDATLSLESYRKKCGLKQREGMSWPKSMRVDLVLRAKNLSNTSTSC